MPPTRRITFDLDLKTKALVVQLLISTAFSLMGSFLPLFINTELNQSLIDATYWTGMAQLAATGTMAVTAPFWGFMCDRSGTRKIMLIVLSGNIIVYFGMAASMSVPELLFFRVLQGTFGGLSTVMFTLVARIVSVDALRKALSYQMVAMTLGNLVGPGVGGLLASIVGYRLTLATSSLLFIGTAPLMFSLRIHHPPDKYESKRPSHVRETAFDVVALLLVYMCISFITPTVPWFLDSLGTPNDQLLMYTTIVNTLTAVAFVLAAPIVAKILPDRGLPVLSVAASVVIFSTAFVADLHQFMAMIALISFIQAGIPPGLLGGKIERRGTSMGILNSARLMGQSLGPFVATSILGSGEAMRRTSMFATLSLISLVASVFVYFALAHARLGVVNGQKKDLRQFADEVNREQMSRKFQQ